MRIKSILCIFFCLFMIIECVIVKNDGSNSKNKIKGNAMPTNRECFPSEDCHECSFDELKNDEDCYETGYKKRIHCVYDNSDEKYYSESCSENIKFNSVYIMLIICLMICGIAYKIQKNQKENLIKNVFAKLSVFKENINN